jgi:superfamily I DNA and/or RNA helicase/very-short-patch-repair endonuclease
MDGLADDMSGLDKIKDPVARLNQILKIWRDKLVAFDGRNRQLYYRKLKSGDVDFEDPYLDISALKILLSGKTVKASTLYPEIFAKIKNKKDIDLSIDENLEADSEEDSKQDKKAIDFSELWAKKLRKYESVYRKAKENYDEKNIETCFIAEGFISWETAKTGPVPNAPLILHPIKIEPTARGNSDFQLTKTGEAFFNQALVLYLQKDFGIEPSLFSTQEELTSSSPEISAIKEKLAQSVAGYSFYDEKVLGNFSFLKYPMVQDINRIIESDTAHMILSALAGNNEGIENLNDTGTETTIEELSNLNPIVENLIFPADSSQHAAIGAVLGGKSIVIQGPPGSGKSQTIANLIAEATVNNKRILFVAEKRAAIDAVVERLTEKGLGGVVLDLHGEPDKKTIAQNLLSAIKAHNLPARLSNTDEASLNSAKNRLNDRWHWLHDSSNIQDFDGQTLTNYEVMFQLGNFRQGLSNKVVAQANLLGNLAEAFTSEKRDETSSTFRDLYNYRYFDDEYQKSEAIKDFKGLTEVEQAETIVDALSRIQASFDSPYWKKIQSLFKKGFRVEAKNIEDFENSFTDIRSHIEFMQFFELKDLAKLEELSDCLLTSAEFRNKHGLNLVSGFFAKRKKKKILRSQIKKPWERSDEELHQVINKESELLEKWSPTKSGNNEIAEVVAEFEPIVNFIESLFTSIKSLQSELPLVIPSQSLTFKELQEILDRYLPISDLIRITPIINNLLQKLVSENLSSVLEVVKDAKLSEDQAVSFWNLVWFSSRLDADIKSQKTWKDSLYSLNKLVDTFRDLDTKHLRSNTSKILSHLTSNFSNLPASDKQLLVKESMKKSGHLPFRELLSRIPESIQKIKPVMAMSPLAVSRLLPSNEGMFDIVIFDEASQIKPEDAITSIYRGKQLVVAGDRFQLPPTNFGEKTIEEDVIDASDFSEDYTDPATTGMESILTTAIGVFSSEKNIKPLRLHYRSKDERLISWSNFNIYRKAGEELFTFPSLDVEGKSALRYTYLPNVKTQSMAVANEAEIQKVKEVVLEHIKKQPDLSLGVIAFGMRHSIRLQDEFNLLEKENDDFYNWKQTWADKREKFFIKNIERVQGDERDSIIISPGYAPNLDGTVPLQFGSLNRQGGERRLNVAASRAKEYVHLVTSLRSQDIELKRTKSASIALLKTFLEFMENQGRLIEPEYELNIATTPFEEEILQKLNEKNLTVDCQVGDSGFKIDFAIRDPKTNKYILAIEADGATYHSSEYARERDYMRQRILEARGWRFVRIWSTDWWLNPEQEIARVMAALGKTTQVTNNPVEEISRSVVSDRYEDIEEYKLLRGIKAQNSGRGKDYIFELWYKSMGFQRRTQNLINRFNNYWRDLP